MVFAELVTKNVTATMVTAPSPAITTIVNFIISV
jgi:hypothetical protein